MEPSECAPSRLVSGRRPPPGTDPIADIIYERRGNIGITSLDANLLHVPQIVEGYNSLLGSIRTKGKLPGDIREAMILRIAALNHAAYEWIQHVDIGRKEGLSTGQLYAIRDTDTPLIFPGVVLNPLQTVAIQFTDLSTRSAGSVSLSLCLKFKHELQKWIENQCDESFTKGQLESKVEDLFVEAAIVVATYNMVSRFLISTDVAGISDMSVPWPVKRKEHFITVPSFPPAEGPTHVLHTLTLTTAPSAPWLVFSNGLNANLSMWNYIIPVLLDLPCPSGKESDNGTYNILLHSQRGHGFSTLPSRTEGQERIVTIPLLASDINYLLEALAIPTPVHSVIGVSQGGATALAFASLYGDKTRSIIVCDTAPHTPAGNKEAWEERITLVCGSPSRDWCDSDKGSKIDIEAYAQNVGMHKLAKVTIPRWFPQGSTCQPETGASDGRIRWLEEMITNTNAHGFFHGAKALCAYDVSEVFHEGKVKRLFDTDVEKVLLIAGGLDGGGKVGEGLKALGKEWNRAIAQQSKLKRALPSVKFVEIAESGHLPMIDSPEIFCKVITSFLTF